MSPIKFHWAWDPGWPPQCDQTSEGFVKICKRNAMTCYDTVACNNRPLGTFPSSSPTFISLLPFLIVLLNLDLPKYPSILLAAGWSEAFKTEVWISHVKGFDNFHGFVFILFFQRSSWGSFGFKFWPHWSHCS